MTLQGDLSTLQLADLLQSLESGAKSGVLTVDGPDGERRMYFADGQLTLFAAEGRPSLVEVFVACGLLTERQLESARKKRRGTRRSMGQVLVEGRRLTQEQLQEIAMARLLDEACELVAADNEAFRFEEGKIPRGVFDPEERRLGLRLAAGPLLMESARREDHWRLIRQRIPSDSAHYMVARDPSGLQDESDAILAELVERLDGTMSVNEVMARFPHRRFDAYRHLAELVESGAVRMARSEDMVKLVREQAPKDPQRGWSLLDRALANAPQDRELLIERAFLGEDLGELEAATEALKILAHLHLESGEQDEAREKLRTAKRLAARDTAVWQRSFDLAVQQERLEDAQADGRHLAELYRSPGLHRKAWKVFEELVELFPEDWELRLELARSQADSGELGMAVEGLENYGRKALADEQYDEAKQAFEAVFGFDAARDDVREKIKSIEAGVFARRRARVRRVVRFLVAATLLSLGLTAALREANARRALAEAERSIARS